MGKIKRQFPSVVEKSFAGINELTSKSLYTRMIVPIGIHCQNGSFLKRTAPLAIPTPEVGPPEK